MQLEPEFSDACYAVASTALLDVVKEISSDTGRRPTVEELSELLTWAARECSTDLGEGVDNRDLTIQVASAGRRKKVSFKRGDVIAIPFSRGRWFAVVYLGKYGSFGHAVGIFKGAHSLADVTAARMPKGSRLRVPRFVDLDSVALGRWKVVNRQPTLAEGFLEPALYHTPRKGDASRGRYGLAETIDGALRKLDRAEADAAGVSAKGFRQAYLGDLFEQFLAKNAS